MEERIKMGGTMAMFSTAIRIALYFVLFGASFVSQAYCQKIGPATKCHIATSSDYDELGQPIDNGIIYCDDYKTGVQWKSEIDLLAGGLWRSANNLTIDYKNNRLFIWASKKTGGPGFRIYDLNSLKMITPDTPLRTLEGASPELRVVGDYLLLFYYDNSYYDTFPTQDKASIYVFDAKNLNQLNYKAGVGGKMGDPIFTDGFNDNFYSMEKWNDTEFPIVKKYTVPELELIDSLSTESIVGDSVEYVRVDDIKSNIVLISALTRWSFKQGGGYSTGYFITIDLPQFAILGFSNKMDFKGFTEGKLSGDGSHFFVQSEEADSIIVFNSISGKPVKAIQDIWGRSLELQSFIEGNELYISSKNGATYKVIDANSGTEIRTIPIARQY
jgi:hypothetical protein